ncbi:hypothetical protein [Streptomyces botrytidirepellens]|uniref:Uncharacterized protein n=1 Tax=Streptomyces botrytidirepellens TaxID=2486417 RepID=A0A3M8WCS6_9ACTN|nr:hypothetical protein [Streptomyces botrytidirepellens]RNG26375.1 hypothetical protein EEJ42_15095 [Streptomyces botrytidirepellens]
MSVIGKEEGIAHGTPRGHRQHIRRQVPVTEECGCLQAKRDEQDAKSAARQAGPTPRAAAQRQWNGGMRGTSRPEANTPVRADCPTEGCGHEAVAEGLSQQRGWVHARVAGSTEPARDYCSGSCAMYGIALAELRISDAA